MQSRMFYCESTVTVALALVGEGDTLQRFIAFSGHLGQVVTRNDEVNGFAEEV